MRSSNTIFCHVDDFPIASHPDGHFLATVLPLQAPVREFPYVVAKTFQDLCKSVSRSADKIGTADFKTINPIGIYYECTIIQLLSL